MAAPSWKHSGSEKDLTFEEDVLRNPNSFKAWWYYLEYKADAPPKTRYVIFERALRHLPGSYKLWMRYLNERKRNCALVKITDQSYVDTNNAFERALVFMHKMPRTWIEYLEFLILQRKLTITRRTFDRALCALPITQHDRIWPIYIRFIRQSFVPTETAIRVFRRFLKVEPAQIEELVDYLKSAGQLDEAAVHLAELVNDEKFVSSKGKSKHELWSEFLRIITKHPDKIHSFDVDAVVRAGLKRFAHEVGQLWNALADYYVRLSHFEKARDVYEEGMATVATVRDFTLVYDAYAQFEESMITMEMEAVEQGEDVLEEDADIGFTLADALDLRMARLADLTERRPLLLNSVLLRQNPHNVQEWHKRVKLFENSAEKMLVTYSEAVNTVDPQLATGKPHTLWTAFARCYETSDDLDNARVVFNKAVEANFKHVDELATVWCQYAEMELRHGNYDAARDVLRRVCTSAPKRVNWYKTKDDDIAVKDKVYRSTKLWSFYADLEENLGSLETTKSVYDQMFELKVITPLLVLNYASFLEENKFFEEAFKAYEKGVAVFTYPHVFLIWAAYLTKFIARFKGTKVERTRDLFERAVEKAPSKEAKKLFLLYAKFEEEYGLARRATAVYDRACKAVAPEDRLEMYEIYIVRVAEFFGLTKTREIYEKAIENLPEPAVRHICLKYANLERKLGEIDRARAIYTYCSQYCNPRVETVFWKVWQDFEVQHGNKETFKEMLRIRRSVTAQYASSNAFGSAVLPGMVKASQSIAGTNSGKAAPANSIEALEQRVQDSANEAQSEEADAAADEREAALALAKPAAQAANPEEISIDDDDDDNPGAGQGDADADTDDVALKSVPSAVFGAALDQAKRSADTPAGAEAKKRKLP